MHERVVVAHVPQRDDHIALDAFRPRRRRRHVALRDALGPARIGFQQSILALCVEDGVHRRPADAGPETPFPRFRVRLQLRLGLEHVFDVACLGVAQLMAEVAVRFQRVDVVVLRQHRRADAVARGAGAGKFIRGGRLEQRQPVVAGIDLRDFLRRARERRGQRHVRARRQRRAVDFHLNRLRVDETVPSDPHAIGRRRQLGDDELPRIAGDDDLDEVGREILRFGDDPDAGLGSAAAADSARDVAVRAAPLCLQSPAGIKGARGNQPYGSKTNQQMSHHAGLLHSFEDGDYAINAIVCRASR